MDGGAAVGSMVMDGGASVGSTVSDGGAAVGSMVMDGGASVGSTVSDGGAAVGYQPFVSNEDNTGTAELNPFGSITDEELSSLNLNFEATIVDPTAAPPSVNVHPTAAGTAELNPFGSITDEELCSLNLNFEATLVDPTDALSPVTVDPTAALPSPTLTQSAPLVEIPGDTNVAVGGSSLEIDMVEGLAKISMLSEIFGGGFMTKFTTTRGFKRIGGVATITGSPMNVGIKVDKLRNFVNELAKLNVGVTICEETMENGFGPAVMSNGKSVTFEKILRAASIAQAGEAHPCLYVSSFGQAAQFGQGVSGNEGMAWMTLYKSMLQSPEVEPTLKAVVDIAWRWQVHQLVDAQRNRAGPWDGFGGLLGGYPPVGEGPNTCSLHPAAIDFSARSIFFRKTLLSTLDNEASSMGNTETVIYPVSHDEKWRDCVTLAGNMRVTGNVTVYLTWCDMSEVDKTRVQELFGMRGPIHKIKFYSPKHKDIKHEVDDKEKKSIGSILVDKTQFFGRFCDGSIKKCLNILLRGLEKSEKRIWHEELCRGEVTTSSSCESVDLKSFMTTINTRGRDLLQRFCDMFNLEIVISTAKQSMQERVQLINELEEIILEQERLPKQEKSLRLSRDPGLQPRAERAYATFLKLMCVSGLTAPWMKNHLRFYENHIFPSREDWRRISKAPALDIKKFAEDKVEVVIVKDGKDGERMLRQHTVKVNDEEIDQLLKHFREKEGIPFVRTMGPECRELVVKALLLKSFWKNIGKEEQIKKEIKSEVAHLMNHYLKRPVNHEMWKHENRKMKNLWNDAKDLMVRLYKRCDVIIMNVKGGTRVSLMRTVTNKNRSKRGTLIGKGKGEAGFNFGFNMDPSTVGVSSDNSGAFLIAYFAKIVADTLNAGKLDGLNKFLDDENEEYEFDFFWDTGYGGKVSGGSGEIQNPSLRYKILQYWRQNIGDPFVEERLGMEEGAFNRAVQELQKNKEAANIVEQVYWIGCGVDDRCRQTRGLQTCSTFVEDEESDHEFEECSDDEDEDPDYDSDGSYTFVLSKQPCIIGDMVNIEIDVDPNEDDVESEEEEQIGRAEQAKRTQQTLRRIQKQKQQEQHLRVRQAQQTTVTRTNPNQARNTTPPTTVTTTQQTQEQITTIQEAQKDTNIRKKTGRKAVSKRNQLRKNKRQRR